MQCNYYAEEFDLRNVSVSGGCAKKIRKTERRTHMFSVHRLRDRAHINVYG